jgi:regulator of protease activity HflC (stomatin/prohibitin superfamily)
MELDATLASRDAINTRMREVIEEAAIGWGSTSRASSCRRSSRRATSAVDGAADARRARAPRRRHQRRSERKRAAILESEGVREAQVRRAEGEKDAAILRAQGWPRRGWRWPKRRRRRSAHRLGAPRG